MMTIFPLPCRRPPVNSSFYALVIGIVLTAIFFIGMNKNATQSSPSFLSSSTRRFLVDDAIKSAHQSKQVIRRSDSTSIAKRSLFNCADPQWTKLGPDIYSIGFFDQSGYSVALSANGQFLALGAPDGDSADGMTIRTGYVRVFRRSDNRNWIQVGQTLFGDATDDNFGRSVALSDTGEILAIGAPIGSIRRYDDIGYVRIFQMEPSSPLGWSQLDRDIRGESPGDLYGLSIAMSGRGGSTPPTIAIAFNNHGEDGTSGIGHVRVYSFSTSFPFGWRQIGQDLDGDAINDSFGSSVAISRDGSIVAIGARQSSTERGYVKVFRYDSSLTSLEWIQEGEVLVGEDERGHYGKSISLSDDGLILAVGAYGAMGSDGTRAGSVSVYNRDLTSTLGWSQIGRDITGDSTYRGTGWSVSLSGNGHFIAIGSIFSHVDDTIDGGIVRVFRRDLSTFFGWEQVGDDIEDVRNEFGYSISLSGNGEVLAIGTPRAPHEGAEGTGFGRGLAKVFIACAERYYEDDTITDPSPTPTITPSLSPSSIPSAIPLSIPTPDLSPSSSSSKKCPPDSDKSEFWIGELKSKADELKEPFLSKKSCVWLANADKVTIKKYCAMKSIGKGKPAAQEECTGACDSC